MRLFRPLSKSESLFDPLYPRPNSLNAGYFELDNNTLNYYHLPMLNMVKYVQRAAIIGYFDRGRA